MNDALEQLLIEFTARIDQHEKDWQDFKAENIRTYDRETGEAAAGRDTDELDMIDNDQAYGAQDILREFRQQLADWANNH